MEQISENTALILVDVQKGFNDSYWEIVTILMLNQI